MLFENGYATGSLMDLVTELIGFLPNTQEEAWIFLAFIFLISISLYSVFKVLLSIFNRS